MGQKARGRVRGLGLGPIPTNLCGLSSHQFERISENKTSSSERVVQLEEQLKDMGQQHATNINQMRTEMQENQARLENQISMPTSLMGLYQSVSFRSNGNSNGQVPDGFCAYQSSQARKI